MHSRSRSGADGLRTDDGFDCITEACVTLNIFCLISRILWLRNSITKFIDDEKKTEKQKLKHI